MDPDVAPRLRQETLSPELSSDPKEDCGRTGSPFCKRLHTVSSSIVWSAQHPVSRASQGELLGITWRHRALVLARTAVTQYPSPRVGGSHPTVLPVPHQMAPAWVWGTRLSFQVLHRG